MWSVGDGEGDEKSGSTIKRIVSAVGNLYVADLKDGRREVHYSGADFYPIATTGPAIPGSIPNLCEIHDAHQATFTVWFRGAVCDPGQAKRRGIFSVFDLATVPEALEGDPSPLSGIPFSGFSTVPAPVGLFDGAFIASLAIPGVEGVFGGRYFREPKKYFVTGDAAPGNAGTFVKFKTLVGVGRPEPHFFLSARLK